MLRDRLVRSPRVERRGFILGYHVGEGGGLPGPYVALLLKSDPNQRSRLRPPKHRADRSADCDDGRKDGPPIGKRIEVEPIHHSILTQQVAELRQLVPR